MPNSKESKVARGECKCGCIIAMSSNTSAVRSGHEMGGYIKHFCKKHGKPDEEVVIGNRYEVKRGRPDLLICDDPIKEPAHVPATMSQQMRAQKLEGYPTRECIESVIGYVLDTTVLHPKVATAIVSMAYNTTLELIARALDASNSNSIDGTTTKDNIKDEED